MKPASDRTDAELEGAGFGGTEREKLRRLVLAEDALVDQYLRDRAVEMEVGRVPRPEDQPAQGLQRRAATTAEAVIGRVRTRTGRTDAFQGRTAPAAEGVLRRILAATLCAAHASIDRA